MGKFGFKLNKCFFGFHNWKEGYKKLKGMVGHSEGNISIYCRQCDKCGKIQYKDRWGDWETYNYKSNGK